METNESIALEEIACYLLRIAKALEAISKKHGA